MDTVFNSEKNIDPREQPLFLGKSLGLARYDKLKYTKIYKLAKAQLDYFWKPEDIDMSKDRSDYESMPQREKDIFTKNLKFQTATDAMLSRSINELLRYVSNPELELCLQHWSFFENCIHSTSYSHIFKYIYPDETKMWDSILEDEEIIKRANAIKESYDRLLSEDDNTPIKEKIFNALVSTNVAEGLLFYVSFAISFYYGAVLKKCAGNCNIIKLIERDEKCLSEDTECLTTKGWVKINNLVLGKDEILQVFDDCTSKFIKPSRIIIKSNEKEMYSLKGDNLDMLLTKDHRVVYTTKEGFKETTPEKMSPDKEYMIVTGTVDTIDGYSVEYVKSIEKVPYEGKVVCVTVPSGMFLARRNGCQFVTGNCHCAITTAILDYFKNNSDEGFQEICENNKEKIVEAYRIACEGEKAWADYLFKDGPLLGLSAEVLKQYAEYRTNERLRLLGFQPIYQKYKFNPLGGWYDEFISEDKQQKAPQEDTKVDYQIGARDTQINIEKFKNFEL